MIQFVRHKVLGW